ncbi:hypothetical protein FA13DRAFT_1786380 [Coprinellus micaceus]|uniref:Uncharacterized protein n=1 Tax=Coprinellus micaceus TaxID=71717 RepID=A0A4Y7TTH7_COPMI|nr:hypothetical protein FA13DRAFT_1786380 [Coprinellus micaceus]
MSLLPLPCSVFRDFYLKEIKTRTRELAGPPPNANYQGHQFAEIRLSFGELSLPNIGRYSAKCVHPNHRDHMRYPNCHKVRMITALLQEIEFEHLRIKIEHFTRITNRPWGLAQQPTSSKPSPIIDVDALGR